MTKVIFVRDSEPFAYEFDGIMGKFFEGIHEHIESGKLNPENVNSLVAIVGQTEDQPGERQLALRYITGDPHVGLEMLSEAIAFFAKQVNRPEVLCGLVCDSAMNKCRTFDTQDSSRIVVPDKRIIH